LSRDTTRALRNRQILAVIFIPACLLSNIHNLANETCPVPPRSTIGKYQVNPFLQSMSSVSLRESSHLISQDHHRNPATR